MFYQIFGSVNVDSFSVRTEIIKTTVCIKVHEIDVSSIEESSIDHQ